MEGKEQLEKTRERIIEIIAQNIHLYGLTPSAGRQFGTMFFHDEPLTLDEMTEELGMSKTSMSTSVRSLSDLKLVERAWKRGVRKDLYKVKDDWYQSFIDLFSIKWRQSVTLYTTSIRKSLNDLNKLLQDPSITEELKQLVESDIEKLRYMQDYYEWLDRLVDAFEDHDIFDLVPRKENRQEERRP
ncbi:MULTISPECIES: GbsR/MarR family transcriptional regulator [Sporosarcina]|uniref:GbsR/MarR family transcriptional regulator n=1 Tax=Sporosarcina TaxID=1569 RepID=UPI00129A62A4|nr:MULTISPECIES: GbsR/MarR family transcriptional regulator [Sporosarcina]GKV67390.1 HTH-type transcriptional repressor OpcR [Sporosarcina sp. NCCP-2331]GLB57746.1 HTH-type transcriptional repressor OpcR [Sporosarcina sp. NCCP-2378]